MVQYSDLQAVSGMIEETDLKKIVRFCESPFFFVVEVENSDRDASAALKYIDRGAHQSVIVFPSRGKSDAETVMIAMDRQQPATQSAGLFLRSDERQVYSINRSITVKQGYWGK